MWLGSATVWVWYAKVVIFQLGEWSWWGNFLRVPPLGILVFGIIVLTGGNIRSLYLKLPEQLYELSGIFDHLWWACVKDLESFIFKFTLIIAGLYHVFIMCYYRKPTAPTRVNVFSMTASRQLPQGFQDYMADTSERLLPATEDYALTVACDTTTSDCRQQMLNRAKSAQSILEYMATFEAMWVKKLLLKSMSFAGSTHQCMLHLYLYIYFVTYRLISVVLVWGSPNLVLGCFIVVLGFPGIIDFSIFQNPVPTSKRFFYKYKHDRKHIDQQAAPSLIAQFLSFASVGLRHP